MPEPIQIYSRPAIPPPPVPVSPVAINESQLKEALDKIEGDTDDNKRIVTETWLWRHADMHALLEERRHDNYWQSAITVAHFVENGRFKKYTKMLKITPTGAEGQATLKDFSNALGPGFGKTYLSNIQYAGTVFIAMLQAGYKYKDMPMNNEASTLLYWVMRKTKSPQRMIALWQAALDDKQNERHLVTKPALVEAAENTDVKTVVEQILAGKKKKTYTEPEVQDADVESVLIEGTSNADDTIPSLKRRIKELENELEAERNKAQKLQETVQAAKNTPATGNRSEAPGTNTNISSANSGQKNAETSTQIFYRRDGQLKSFVSRYQQLHSKEKVQSYFRSGRQLFQKKPQFANVKPKTPDDAFVALTFDEVQAIIDAVDDD